MTQICCSSWEQVARPASSCASLHRSEWSLAWGPWENWLKVTSGGWRHDSAVKSTCTCGELELISGIECPLLVSVDILTQIHTRGFRHLCRVSEWMYTAHKKCLILTNKNAVGSKSWLPCSEKVAYSQTASVRSLYRHYIVEIVKRDRGFIQHACWCFVLEAYFFSHLQCVVRDPPGGKRGYFCKLSS